MKEFYIYKLQDTYIEYAKLYPKTIHLLARISKNTFNELQKDLIFMEHMEINDLLAKMLTDRNDYTYKHLTHYIKNEITGASCLVKVFDHCIYARCSENFMIIPNIILQSDLNYVILDK